VTPNRAVTVALTAALALAGPSLLAQGSRRGGGGAPAGGGRPGGGGGYAVPRGGAPAHPGYAPRGGGVAGARHPGAGTGGYYNPGHGGAYRPYYGGYYGGRPYGYGYYGYGYRRPYPYASFYLGFGWPYYSYGWPYYSSYGWPYGYGSPSYSVSYYGYPSETSAAPPADQGGAPVANRDTGRVRVEVRPDDASVYVDDEFWGNARDTKFLTLRSGRHSIELVRPGFEVARQDVDVVRGETSDVFVELRRP
jgi:hypothetical protein